MHPVAGLFRIVSSFLVLTFNLDQRGMATGYMPTFYTPLGIGFMRCSLFSPSDENGRKRTKKPTFLLPFLYFFFGGNGIGFGKYGYGNGIGLRGNTETNQYGC